MKDSSATVSQLALLQQKLHSAKLALDEVNEDRNAKLQTLLQFIGRFCSDKLPVGRTLTRSQPYSVC